MNDDIVYLEFDEVVEIQMQMLEHYGGASDFRGEEGVALVESAVNRPKYKGIYGGADLLAQAASLYYGLVKNHGFVDGNKRVGVAACDAFLQESGWELTCSNEELIAFTLRCSEESWTEAAVEDFVRQHTARLA